ncbi:unnamed protein product (macronuclear) [Paramecium tetraurelia]|uniref:WD40-repeat-containing domain n=1 Tax=Paramecium tetraurelia TaxID=5888 RepID=A0CY57_PARTE|nr:uncharacterized protein GSPATT00011356001 [Paramecium tetraurelia]CAK75724.1 unnamed protein product [Paramecium tetraurelia]|eukprot:XP_001443121.1 hypothetical protein (macronuclear) [Paramecium tetraurelia strain d4-2]
MNDQLNDWDFCNPNNFVDKLPEPFRFINKIIQKDILLEVYSKVFLIEKYRSDPNYEGPLRTLPPQGIFDISNITSISSNSSNLQIAAGDLQGNIFILDMSKKTKICKKEVSPKRINKVCLGIRDGANDEQKNICIIGVISHLDPVVQIFKYKPGENKISQIHFIQVTKNATGIGELPMDIEISKYSQYILITQYNGNVVIYKIPELKVESQQPTQATSQQNQNTLLPPLQNQKQQATKEQLKQQIPLNPQTDVAVTEITELFYQIKFQGLKKEQKFNEIINSFKEQNLPKEVEVKEDKKKQQPNAQPQKKQEVIQQVKEESGLEENNNQLIIKHQIKDGYDISEEYPIQKFKPYFAFIHETVNVQNGQKAFDKFKQFEVVVGIVVGWSNTTKLELHYFNQPKRNNLPQYLIAQFTQEQEMKFQLPIINKKNETRLIEIPLIYPLSCLAVSKNFSLLGLGLQQGSILIYDLVFQQERFYLDKHQTIVSHIEFCENERIVSCSYDGSIHIYNTIEGITLCKRTNQFRKGTKINYDEQKQGLWRIMSLAVSSSGIAVVQDAESEVRLYDVWRGEKIAKLSPVQVMDDQKRKWSDQKVIIKCFRNEILVSAQVFTQEQQQNSSDQILTTVQIFKIFDSLVNLFPSLSNVYRKGVEKEKILNLFEKIPKQELWNAQFEVPNLSVSHQNVALKVPGQDSKTQKGSQILHNQSQYSQPKLNQSKTSQQKLKDGVKESQVVSQQQDIYENRSASLVGSLHKSVHSDKFDYNSSFRSTNSPQNNLNLHKTQKGNQSQIGLTKEMLHPEEHLLEKSEQQPAQLIFENSSMVEHCRLRNSEKQLRSEKVSQSLLKLGQRLAIEDEKMKLQIRYRQLQKVK